MNNIEIESFQGENLEESEMGQRLAQILNDNALDAVRKRMSTGPSLEECTDCGEAIPEQRRLAVQGCQCCIHCQTLRERKV